MILLTPFLADDNAVLAEPDQEFPEPGQDPREAKLRGLTNALVATSIEYFTSRWRLICHRIPPRVIFE